MKPEKRSTEVTDGRPLSRREFTSLSLAACVAAAGPLDVAQAAAEISDENVDVHTPAGVCDAALVRPQGQGSWPAAILFSDAFGLRPTMREMAARLARQGYTVLVPNPFYRKTKAPGTGPGFDFQNPADLAKLKELQAPLTNDGVMQDAVAYAAFLDRHPAVKKSARMGAFGYCMGGKMTMQAAAGVPDRIGAGASFHGGGLATDKPDSPHLLVPKMKAQFYFGIAASDDQREPEAKTKLAEAFRAAHLTAKIEVYEGALHGWCVKDVPSLPGKLGYNEALAERAWKELTALFKRTVV
ncbi:MAG TPA: dienelactone hydrolase family protein [Burkholderiaceae bacterium]|nr:dienelactone hydrolase family protein [Burkholderiaceae bacterium]